MSYTNVLPSDIRENIASRAGVLLSTFDFAHPYRKPTDSEIIAVTSGGINPTCEPQTEDLFSDVDNAPDNTKEGLIINGYNCAMSFTNIAFNEKNVQFALSSSDIETLENGIKKITPRIDVSMSDFRDIYWAIDKLGGGLFVIKMENAWSTGGLNIQSTKNGKATSQITLTGYASAKNVEKVPMEYYIIPPEGGEVSGVVELNYHSLELKTGKTAVLVAGHYPADAEVTWRSGDDTVATVTNGGVIEAVGTGNTIIRASITVDGVEFTDTCTVVVTA